MTTSPFFANSVAGAQTQIWIGLTSILYAICILLIPGIAFFVLKAEFGAVGGALLGLLATTNQATRLAGNVGAKAGGNAATTLNVNSQGMMGRSPYQNLSVPPPATPPRATMS
jgi:hypothetical protein